MSPKLLASTLTLACLFACGIAETIEGEIQTSTCVSAKDTCLDYIHMWESMSSVSLDTNQCLFNLGACLGKHSTVANCVDICFDQMAEQACEAGCESVTGHK